MNPRAHWLTTVRLEPTPILRHVAGDPLHAVDEIRGIAARANLLYELTHRDLTVRYKRSVLGFLWTMLHPLLLMLIFVVVFSRLFRHQTPNYEVYFLSAYVAWNFFSQTTVNAMASVAWNGPLMKRVPVPPSIFTLSTTLSGLINLALSLLLLFVIMLIARAPLTPALVMVPLGLLILGIFTYGVSLVLTAVSVFFADVREMVQAAMPALLYLTPIIYPITIVPEQFRWLIQLNPMLYIVTIVRDPIYSGTIPSLRIYAIASISALVALVIGWMTFARLAPRFHGRL